MKKNMKMKKGPEQRSKSKVNSTLGASNMYFLALFLSLIHSSPISNRLHSVQRNCIMAQGYKER